MRSFYAFITITIIMMTACKTAKPTSGSMATPEPAISANAGKTSNYILAVILRATRSPKDHAAIVFEIINTTKKEGKLKPGQNDNSGNDFTVSFANDKNVPIATYHIQNPLDTWMESTDEHEKLKTLPVHKEEESISVRTNYTPGMKNLIIKKNAKDSNTIIIPLNIQ